MRGPIPKRRAYTLLAWVLPGVLAGTLTGCGQQFKATAPDPGHRPTIAHFDTFAGADSVLVVWDAGNYPAFDLDARRPAPPVRSVVLLLSSAGPGSGFSRIVEHVRTGPDSAYVTGLQGGRSYFFQIETYDSLGVRIDRSEALETQTGPPAQLLSTFGTVDRDGGLYYPPVAWARGGESVLYIQGMRSTGPNLFEHDLATGVDRAVTAFPEGPARLLGVAARPDSDEVAFSYSPGEQGGPYTVRVLDLRSGMVRTVTEGPVDADPAWGNGGQLFFTRGTNGPPNIPQIYAINAGAPEAATAVLVNDQYKYGLSLDPTGGRLAYSASAPGDGDILHQSLFALTLATGHVDRLTAADPWNDQAPAWSADGTEIDFVSDRSGHYEAWSLNVAGGSLTQRTRARERGVECRAARPSPDGGRLAVFETTRGSSSGTVRVIRVP